MGKFPLKATVKRIEKMEKYFDALSVGLKSDPPEIDKNALKILTEYYDGGQWLKDYTADEKGLLPDLKRGVLSEDGLYNLLEKIAELNGCR